MLKVDSNKLTDMLRKISDIFEEDLNSTETLLIGATNEMIFYSELILFIVYLECIMLNFLSMKLAGNHNSLRKFYGSRNIKRKIVSGEDFEL